MKNVDKITTQESYIKFLQVVSNKELSITSLEYLFGNLDSSIKNYKADIQTLTVNTNDTIKIEVTTQVDVLTNRIKNHYEEKLSLRNIEEKFVILNQSYNLFKCLKNQLCDSSSGIQLYENINKCFQEAELPAEILQILELLKNYFKNLDLLKSIHKELNSISHDWTKCFESVVQFLAENDNFYNFLQSFISKYKSIEVQMSKEKTLLTDIENNEFFFEKIKHWQLPHHDMVKNMKLSEMQSIALDRAKKRASNTNIFTDSPGELGLIIKNDTVVFSQFLEKKRKYHGKNI